MELENLVNNHEKMKEFLGAYNEYVVEELGEDATTFTVDDTYAWGGWLGIAYTTAPGNEDVDINVKYNVLTKVAKFSASRTSLGDDSVRYTCEVTRPMDYERALELLDFDYAICVATDFFENPFLVEGVHYNC